ncbi:DUF4328 domain-containing protein [Umezawaea tangerina]|uniref:Uncharacterized protein DUF4328 n=1 Tax=Umezawaea tangerina TaxID=84725 RepID=A0A2T0TE13_9PSEU|nr:DUF4328 domain-containing protein [Umezawaea tangerina]PRY43900.1 uncharacterized protein DUF4328 [Umezawaea tangerina]
MDAAIPLRVHVVSTQAGLLSVLLGLQAAVQVVSIAVPVLRFFVALLFLCTVPVLLVWLHRVRLNAEVPGRVHRWGPGWVVGMWFVPVLNLWAPYRAVADIAAAGVPRARREEVTRQVLAWWLSWLVGLVTTAMATRVWLFGHHVWAPLLPAWVGAVFFALASALLIAVVRRLSALHPVDERLVGYS